MGTTLHKEGGGRRGRGEEAGPGRGEARPGRGGEGALPVMKMD